MRREKGFQESVCSIGQRWLLFSGWEEDKIGPKDWRNHLGLSICPVLLLQECGSHVHCSLQKVACFLGCGLASVSEAMLSWSRVWEDQCREELQWGGQALGSCWRLSGQEEDSTQNHTVEGQTWNRRVFLLPVPYWINGREATEGSLKWQMWNTTQNYKTSVMIKQSSLC